MASREERREQKREWVRLKSDAKPQVAAVVVCRGHAKVLAQREREPEQKTERLQKQPVLAGAGVLTERISVDA